MITDIKFTKEFYNDYDVAPLQVKKAMDKLVRLILDGGKFPNSMNVHSAKSVYNDVYIGYVTRSGQHWRVLFETDTTYIVILRLLDHNEADKYLNQFV